MHVACTSKNRPQAVEKRSAMATEAAGTAPGMVTVGPTPSVGDAARGDVPESPDRAQVEGQQWAGWADMARVRGLGRPHTFGDAVEVAPSRPVVSAGLGGGSPDAKTALNCSHRVRAAETDGTALHGHCPK